MSVYEGELVPSVEFKTRELGEWKNVTTFDLFSNKRVIVFALPGAFTPTCSSKQLPGYEELYDQFIERGIDEVYCLSVNDSFVMNAWFDGQGIEKVKPLPDGSQLFTDGMGMSVSKDNLGFGMRSWRYAMVVDHGKVEKLFVEDGFGDDIETDPYEESAPETVLAYLKSDERYANE